MHDIVVVGAGGCGLMAALVAAKAGARVLLIEKTGAHGGGTAFSHRGIRAAGTRYQRDLRIVDDPERYAGDILRRNRGQGDVAVTARLTEVSGRMVHFLADTAGVDFSVDEFTFGQSARRSHVWSADRPITDFMFDAVRGEAGIEVRFSVPVLSLARDGGGAVTGVATREGILPGRKVILASGGFAAGGDLLSRYIPEAVGIPFPGHHGSTGEGIEMGVAAGAAVAHMGAFQPYPAHVGPGKRAVPPDVIMAGGIIVEAGGRRFVDETRYPGGLAAAILALPGKHAYEVFDERLYRMHQGGAGDRSLSALSAAGLLRVAGSIEELAADLGIDGAGLRTTVGDYNLAARSGVVDAFGRTLGNELVAPFHGIVVTVAIYHTQGGLTIDADGQVLRADGTVIPNLYAGGGAAAGVSGDGLDGYLPGNGLLASLGLGMIAAEHAVASLAG